MGSDGSELETALIVTTSPNREVSAIHTRMPAVIAPGDCQTWLAGDVKDAVTLSRPAPDGTFSLTPVSIARPGKPSARISLFDV